jgi:hypothetical protein
MRQDCQTQVDEKRVLEAKWSKLVAESEIQKLLFKQNSDQADVHKSYAE